MMYFLLVNFLFRSVVVFFAKLKILQPLPVEFLGDCLSNRSLYAIGPLSVLPVCDVTLMYCGQMVGWIKIPRGIEIGLGSCHIALDGDPASPSKTAQHPSPIFGPRLLWPNGWMYQVVTWYGSRPWPRPHCVRWGP